MKLREGNVFIPVSQSFCSQVGGGLCLWIRGVSTSGQGLSASGFRGEGWLMYIPQGRHSPVGACLWARGMFTSGQTLPQADTPQADSPPRQATATKACGTHPTGMNSCFFLGGGGERLSISCNCEMQI